MQIISGAATDVGRKRTQNEDYYKCDPQTRLYVVADGMGGQAAGEVASETAANAIHRFIHETDGDRDKTWPFPADPALSFDANRLRLAILFGNRAVARRIGDDKALEGMATTVAALLCGDKRAVVTNVGDCRIYLLRDGDLTQITADHSWVADQVRAGIITAAEARTHPWRNMVTRALSGVSDLAVDVKEIYPQPGDRFLLCSDGLHGVVPDTGIHQIMSATVSHLDEMCRALVDAANGGGGPDNITAVIVEIRE